MPDLHIEPSPATLGATVRGVELAHLGPAEWRAIEAAFHDRAVLVFPGQHLSATEQADFGRRFGDLSIEAMAFTNENPDGTIRPVEDALVGLLRGNEGWHTDSSFAPLAAKASILSAVKMPASGGETEWADMRAAYEALDEATRQRIATLSALHSLVHSQAVAGQGASSTASALASLRSPGYSSSPDQLADPPLRPLVKTHPVTGRPSLFIGRHAYGIPGMGPAESERLLADLLDLACRPPRVLQHRWAPGDVVIWDNRCVLHRARPYDPTQPRIMHHTRVRGDPATEYAAPSRGPAHASGTPSSLTSWAEGPGRS
ncbi:MAG: TauD/TfdA family dioxygenase [Acidimicrobiia bacterium]|nr:TauD/TfdA family dioxygenase [Acidimicrobiia bacterium]